MDGEPRPLPGGRGRHERSSILADRRQRRVLSELASVSQPVTVDELCHRLAARDDDTAGSTLESIRIDLRHRCLPGLETAGWIERRPDGIRLDDPLFADSVPFSTPSLRDPDDTVWDVVSALLARPYRRHVLVAVAECDGPLTVEELAVELRGVVDDERTLPTSLHHIDLPKLDALGAIEYDRDGRAAEPSDRLPTYLDRLELDA
ncbi:DUF7344 domain-containing protein [Haloplanus rubicundus]